MLEDHFEQNRQIGQRSLGRILRAVAIAALVCLVLPSWAEERAVKTRVAPVYPEMARRLKISGSVVVKATVEPDGKVSEAKAVNGNRMLANAAEDAVRKWKFASSAESTTIDVEVNFALGQ